MKKKIGYGILTYSGITLLKMSQNRQTCERFHIQLIICKNLLKHFDYLQYEDNMGSYEKSQTQKQKYCLKMKLKEYNSSVSFFALIFLVLS